jgi:hypothetical protein
MEFDVVITQEPDASWRAVTAALPNCEVNVGTEFRVVLPLMGADSEVLALAIGTR